MVRGGKAVRSRTDYILGTDRSLFRNVAVRDPRYNSDHYMVMGLLRGRYGANTEGDNNSNDYENSDNTKGYKYPYYNTNQGVVGRPWKVICLGTSYFWSTSASKRSTETWCTPTMVGTSVGG